MSLTPGGLKMRRPKLESRKSRTSLSLTCVPLTRDARRGGTLLRSQKYDYELHIPYLERSPYTAMRTFVMSRHRVSLLSQGCALACRTGFIFALLCLSSKANRKIWLHFPADQHKRYRPRKRRYAVKPIHTNVTSLGLYESGVRDVEVRMPSNRSSQAIRLA